MAFRSPLLGSLFHHLLSIMDILLAKVKTLDEGLHRSSSITVLALVGSLIVVVDEKLIQISLDLLKRS